ncbi:hypothetical protein K4R08_06090 [Staphylococcus epidermidis]|nr:hypothetical protein [Staphylococcus epidermidis]
MQSIWVFESSRSEVDIKNLKTTRYENLNGVEEELTTELFVNEDVGEYVRCNLVVDEPKSLQVRALGQNLNSVIVRNRYEAFYRQDDGNLVVYANKNAANIIKDVFNDEFELGYQARTIELEEIINTSNNVRRAQFKNVTIETVTGGMLNGDQVHNTEIYDLMDSSGDLSTVAVVYPFLDKEISFSVSKYGSILIYTTITYEECLELINDLFEL